MRSVAIRVDTRIGLVGDIRRMGTGRGIVASRGALVHAHVLGAVKVGVDAGVELIGDVGIMRSRDKGSAGLRSRPR